MSKLFSTLLVGFLAVSMATAHAEIINPEKDKDQPLVQADKKGGHLLGLKSYNKNIKELAENKDEKKWFNQLRYSGYVRMWMFYRNMDKYYNITPAEGLTLPENLTFGDGYQEPLVLFRLEANPSPKTWFQMEWFFDNRLMRAVTTNNRTDENGRTANLYRIFQFTAGQYTKYGYFKLIAGGGVNWYKLSPFTLWNFQYRDDMFERYPWEPEGNNFARYNSFYSVGDIPRDQRWGNRGTQGFILEATGLPLGFDASILWGKNENSGGFQSFLTKTPQNMISGRVSKRLGGHKIGYTYYNQYGYDANVVDYRQIIDDKSNVNPADNDTFYVEDNRLSQVVTTLDARFSFDKFSIFAEAGMGSYLSSEYNDSLKGNVKPGIENVSRYKRLWDEALYLEFDLKPELTFVPIKLAMYRIGGLVINNTSTIFNTSVEQVKQGADQTDEFNTTYFDGMVTEIGQLANNRQGVNFTTSKSFGPIRTKLSLAMAQELENLYGDSRNGARGNVVVGASATPNAVLPFTNSITFQHRLNALSRSRFHFFQRFAGPYNRLHAQFRRTFENIVITDTTVDYKKSFSTLDLELKYKFRLFGRELIVSNYINYNSVQENWSPIPVFSDKAFLRTMYEEFMVFYNIHPKLTLIGFFGMERVQGNDRTELADANGDLITDANGTPIADPNGKPVDQTGYGYGFGVDYDFANRASLHLRQRWIDHSDANFIRDEFKGIDMTVELKIFF